MFKEPRGSCFAIDGPAAEAINIAINPWLGAVLSTTVRPCTSSFQPPVTAKNPEPNEWVLVKNDLGNLQKWNRYRIIWAVYFTAPVWGGHWG